MALNSISQIIPGVTRVWIKDHGVYGQQPPSFVKATVNQVRKHWSGVKLIVQPDGRYFAREVLAEDVKPVAEPGPVFQDAPQEAQNQPSSASEAPDAYGCTSRAGCTDALICDFFTALALAALVELGTAYYLAAPHMSDSLRLAVVKHLDFCFDVVGMLPHTPGRGVQVVHGNRRYEWGRS